MVKLKEGSVIESKTEKGLIVAKKLTPAQQAKIAADTKAKAIILAALPPLPYQKIILSMKLGSKTPSELSNYVSDKFPRIVSVVEVSACNPSVDVCSGINDILFPLAIISAKNRTEDQTTALGLYTTQLHEKFTDMIKSCANLCNGNLLLFALLNIATKKASEKHNKQLDATKFFLNAKKGPGNIGVRTMKMEFADDYTLYYGIGAYDVATWKRQKGGCFSIIKGLTPGQKINVIVVANGKMGEGHWQEPQTITVPYN